MEHHHWMSCFGDEPSIVAELWARIDPEIMMPCGIKATHMMWVLYFLRVYNVEEVNAQKLIKSPNQLCIQFCLLSIDTMFVIHSEVRDE
jgi:hypothetical protein